MHSYRCVPKELQVLPESQWLCYPCNHTTSKKDQVEPISEETDCNHSESEYLSVDVDNNDSMLLDTEVCNHTTSEKEQVQPFSEETDCNEFESEHLSIDVDNDDSSMLVNTEVCSVQGESFTENVSFCLVISILCRQPL